ncbi:MAG: M50 family metallopeptidase [Limisphaerales bacterium]
MQFNLLGFPVRVDWWFWLTSALLGGGLRAQTSSDWAGVGIWAIVVFVSILWHELGHALVGRRFGALPDIVLHGFGGTAYMHGARFTRTEDFLTTAAGPAASVLLGLAVLGASLALPDQSPVVREVIRDALWVNFGWTVINLLPVVPLDGGHMLRATLGPRRERLTAWIGCIVAAVAAAVSLSTGLLFMGILFAVMAWQNYPNRSPG